MTSSPKKNFLTVMIGLCSGCLLLPVHAFAIIPIREIVAAKAGEPVPMEFAEGDMLVQCGDRGSTIVENIAKLPDGRLKISKTDLNRTDRTKGVRSEVRHPWQLFVEFSTLSVRGAGRSRGRGEKSDIIYKNFLDNEQFKTNTLYRLAWVQRNSHTSHIELGQAEMTFSKGRAWIAGRGLMEGYWGHFLTLDSRTMVSHFFYSTSLKRIVYSFYNYFPSLECVAL